MNQKLDTLSLRIEQFYSEVFIKLSDKYQGYKYKNVALSEIAIKFYLNQFINDTLFFKEIAAVKREADWNIMIQMYVDGFEIKNSFFYRIIYIFLDIIRYFKYLFTKAYNYTVPDYYFFITNKKFINYTEGIRNELSKKNISSGLLIWDPNDVTPTIKMISNTPKVAFPHFWTKDYFQYRTYVHSVDRVLGYQVLRKARKIILVEGSVVVEHIISEVCKSKKIDNDCIQWGFFAKTVTQAGWREMPFDKFITWGKFYTDQFKLYNSLEIKAIGHPILEEKININTKKTILFAVQKVMGDHLTEKNIYTFIEFAIRFAISHSDFNVIIRSHPDFIISKSLKDIHKEVKTLIWHDYQDFSLQGSLEISKYCVSISSTVTLESLVHGCYPLFLKVNNLPLQLHHLFNDNEDYKHVVTYNDFDETIFNLEKMSTEDYLDQIKNDFYRTLGSQAINQITEEILNNDSSALLKQ